MFCIFFGDEQLKCACLFNAAGFRELDKESSGSLCCCREVGRDDVNSSCMRGDLLNSLDFGTIGNPRFRCSRLRVIFVVGDWENVASEPGIVISELETAVAPESLFCPTGSELPFSSISLSASALALTVDEFMCHFLRAAANTSS